MERRDCIRENEGDVMGMNSQMDPKKTKQLIESSRDYEMPEVTGQAVGLACEAVADLRIAVLEQDKRARYAEEERELLSKRIDELEAENKVWRKDVEDAAGELLVSIPSPGSEAAKMLLANRAMVRELSANRDRIAELEKERDGLNRETEAKAEMIANLVAKLEAIALNGDVVPTNENFVRVAMVEHHGRSKMRTEYVNEWSRRFGPALDIIRTRVAFKINELECKLAEAIDIAGEAIPYVSDYFRTKYELDARLAKLVPKQSADKLTE